MLHQPHRVGRAHKKVERDKKLKINIQNHTHLKSAYEAGYSVDSLWYSKPYCDKNTRTE